MNTNPPSHFPSEVLEQRATEQRRRLHNSVSELRSSLTGLKSAVEEDVRERLDPNRIVRQRLGQFSAAASLLGLFLGYGLTGLFTRR
jgi:hypothetical protein